MAYLRCVLARWRALFRRDVVAGEIRDEMQFHLQMRAEEYERQGLTADEARRAASRRFGNLALMQDRGYDVRGGGIMETVLQDVRYGVRLLFRHRAFSAIAILTLATGIGLSTALFSVIDAALLRPLPYPHPEQLVDVMVGETYRGESGLFSPSMADIRSWRESGRIFAHVGAGRVTGFVPRVVDAGVPERVIVGDLSEDFLEVFGLKPLLGRSAQIEDVREGAPVVALLGHAYWQSRFGGTPDVLGRVIRIDDVPATIVGVLPAGFYRETAVWQPTQISAARTNWRGSGTPVNGRLRPGVTIAQAERELTEIAKTTPAGPGPFHGTNVHVELTSMYDNETSGSRQTVTFLACAVSLILLIACALRTLPELAAAGAVDFLPLREGFRVTFVKGHGQTNVVTKQVLPGYFEALGQPVKLGRPPTDSDRTSAEPVVLINEDAARRFFPDGSPVGRFLETVEATGYFPRRIIGVVGNVRLHGPEHGPRPEVYFLYGQPGSRGAEPMRIVLRPRPSAVLSADRLRQIAEAVGPRVLVGRIRSGTDDLSETVVRPRHRTVLLSLLGGLGMVLTLVGIFSMTAYAVTRRTQEIGIRMAFGARPAHVVGTMVRDAAWPAFLGLFVGMVGALYGTRVVASFLFDTTPHDPVTFAAVAVFMSVAALVAAWMPARRAARINPVIALRAE